MIDAEWVAPTTRDASIELYKRLLAAARSEGKADAAERFLACNDLFFLMVSVLGRRDVNRDWLFHRCREVERDSDGYLDLWSREHYKMLPLNEPVPTPSGWTTHGQLVPGDEVFAPDGSICRVAAVTEVFVDGAAFELEFDDGYKIKAGADHLWPVERRTSKRIPLTYNRPDVRQRQYREKALLTTAEIAALGAAPDARIAIPVTQSMELPEADLPIDPYVLGAWLGDGTSATGDITCADSEIFDEIQRRGYHVGHDKTPMRSSRFSRVIGLRALLQNAGLVNNKHIPSRYLRGSINQRMGLLRGLMDTDGTCDSRGTATFCNTNERLVEGICELLNTLAMKPRRRRHSFVRNGEPYNYWQVSFQAYAEFPPFSLVRKVARCRKGARKNARRFIVACRPIDPEPMSCIQVDRDDGLYVCGRSFLPTHNSSIITYALTIRDILRDPEITVGIFSYNRPIAKAFLRQIKREFEANDKLRTLFSDIAWENPWRDAPKWSEDDGIIVRRKGNPKEATVEAWGLVDAQPTSKHFRLMIYDDVVTRESVTNPDMIAKVTEAWETSRNLTAEGGATRYIGTRWHFNDTYHAILARGAATERRYPATVNGEADGEPVLMTRERLAEKRRDMGPHVFGAQMLLNPVADRSQGFQESWLRYLDGPVSGDGMNKYILVDAANSKKKGSDYTAMGVIGLGADENYYLLDMVRDRLNLTERGDALFALHRRWRPLGVGYEQYGMMADIEYIRERQQLENYRFDVVELGGAMPKADRIKRMVPVFEAGRFILPQHIMKKDYEGRLVDLVVAFVEEEYKPFPVAFHDDMFDMISRIRDMPTIWPRPKVKEDRYAKPRERPRGRSAWAA